MNILGYTLRSPQNARAHLDIVLSAFTEGHNEKWPVSIFCTIAYGRSCSLLLILFGQKKKINHDIILLKFGAMRSLLGMMRMF